MHIVLGCGDYGHGQCLLSTNSEKELLFRAHKSWQLQAASDCSCEVSHLSCGFTRKNSIINAFLNQHSQVSVLQHDRVQLTCLLHALCKSHIYQEETPSKELKQRCSPQSPAITAKLQIDEFDAVCLGMFLDFSPHPSAVPVRVWECFGRCCSTAECLGRSEPCKANAPQDVLLVLSSLTTAGVSLCKNLGIPGWGGSYCENPLVVLFRLFGVG